MTRWPHQLSGVIQVVSAIQMGERRILLTSPTGGGKTQIAADLIADWLAAGEQVVLYTNRKMLVEQTSEKLQAAGLDHGIRAAGYGREDGQLQVSSIQTEIARVLRDQSWGLYPATRVLIDEAHVQTGERTLELLNAHVEQGAVLVGLTATPINLGRYYDCLLIAGNTSALRTCGALVPALHYGPDEPDLRKLKGLREGLDLSEGQQKQAMSSPPLWGRVWEWFERLNPSHEPTILFADSVEKSIWFAEQFEAKGVKAAHIDGQDVWVDGELHRSNRRVREQILAGSRTGDICVLCNRFVLREGIDAPWLSHGIFACVFGSLQSYLQSGGRLLRAHPGVGQVTIQDHGGNWWRHGSLNEDRNWFLELTDTMAYGLRADRLREGTESKPRKCPQCGLIVRRAICLCGFDMRKAKVSRPVLTTDGRLVELEGDVFPQRRTYTGTNGPKDWERMYYRSKTEKGRRTFREAMALFAMEHNWGYPSPDWPFMPREPLDHYRFVGDVPREELS